MDPSPIPINVCKLQETNETKIEETYNLIHKKLNQVKQECTTLKTEVRNLDHEKSFLEKEEYCLDSKNKVLEGVILSLKSQTEEAANTVELLKWKMYKFELIKEFEQKCNESAYKIIHERNESLDHSSIEVIESQSEKIETPNVTQIKKNIAQLKEEIEKKKKSIQMTDPKLLTNMKILEKRNAALLVRYQRQLGEANSRYRQTLTEVNSLNRLLAEKNALLEKATDLS